MGRTAKDERAYDKILRREAVITPEVIVHFSDQNKLLWANQVGLLKALIEAGDALRTYRLGALRTAEMAVKDNSGQPHCVPGCSRHEWHDDDGWHRTDEKD